MSVSTRLTKTKPSSSVWSSSSVFVIPSTFDFVGWLSSMSSPAKMSPILPTPWTVDAGLAEERQVVRLARLEREVVPVRRALVVPRLADERPGDHPPDRVLAGEDLAGGAAAS